MPGKTLPGKNSLNCGSENPPHQENIASLPRGGAKIADESAEQICAIISLQLGSSRNDYALSGIFWDCAWRRTISRAIAQCGQCID